jgi:hypothetical protein
MGTGSLPGVKRPGRRADHPPPPSAEVENEYLHSPSRPLVTCYRVTFTLLKRQHDVTTGGFAYCKRVYYEVLER